MGFFQRAGATVGGRAWACHYGGFSCGGAQALESTGFRSCTCGLNNCSSQALEHRLSHSGAQA